MITIKHAALDAAAAAKLADELRAAGLETTPELQQGKNHIFIPVLSPNSEKDGQMQRAILHALDNGQFIIPAMAQKTAMPKIVDHLSMADLNNEDDTTAIITRIRAFMQRDEQIIMKVHTPRVQAANRRIGLVLAFLTLFMCSVGVFLVAGGVVQFPKAEYDAVDTAEAATIEAIIGEQIAPVLPRSTEDALQFSSTLQAQPTRYRPALAATATAIAATAQP